jgi:hypothetical protein
MNIELNMKSTGKVSEAYAYSDPAFQRFGKPFISRGTMGRRTLFDTCTTTLVMSSRSATRTHS